MNAARVVMSMARREARSLLETRAVPMRNLLWVRAAAMAIGVS